jgi:hypothetical protein
VIRKALKLYGKLLRIEALIAIGFFGGCAFTGFLVGMRILKK